MKKVSDPYEWTKSRIQYLYNNVKDWSDDNEKGTSKHDAWSIKKLIALDYYIPPFVKIMGSAGFKKWYYVDPFSGSGLIHLTEKKYKFPGSPLIPLFRSTEWPFHKYHLADNNGEYVDILKKRVERVRKDRTFEAEVKKADFVETIEAIFDGKKPARWKDAGYLVFLDPFGLHVDWNSMERILKSGPVDVIFTFMTWAIVWNRTNKLAADKLTAYFGNEEWKSLRTQDEFVNHYRRKIEKIGYLNNYKTFTIDVIQDGGKRYDLILATQSKGGANVLKDLKKYVKSVTTDLLRDAFNVTVGDQVDLDKFTAVT